MTDPTVQAPAPPKFEKLQAIAAYERREIAKPRVSGPAIDENPITRKIDAEIAEEVGFSLELAGKERVYWADTPRQASEQIVKLWDLIRGLKKRLAGHWVACGQIECRHCGRIAGEDYAVLDEVWALTGLKPKGGRLHLRCLEKVLGRPLSLRDFKSAPINAGVRFGYEMRERELLRNGELR